MQACQKANRNSPMAKLDADSSFKVKVNYLLQPKIDIEVQLCNCNGVKETELIQDVSAITKENGEIILSSIITHLKNMGYMLLGAGISYYSYEFAGFIFCDVDPISDAIAIPYHEIIDDKLIVRGRIDPAILMPLDDAKRRIRRSGTLKRRRHRVKIRKIGQVIEQVTIWRKYYNGYIDYHGKLIKLSLEEAANKVGVPKKSLNDYFFQLRTGGMYGFDFNEHKDDNIGVLRNFIKSTRRREVQNRGKNVRELLI